MGDNILGLFDTSDTDPVYDTMAPRPIYETMPPAPVYGIMAPPVYQQMAAKATGGQAGWTPAVTSQGRQARALIGHAAQAAGVTGWAPGVAAPGRVAKAQIGHAARPGWTAATTSPNRTPVAQIGRQAQPVPMPAMMPPLAPPMQQAQSAPQPGIFPEIDMHQRNLGEESNGVKYISDYSERVSKYRVLMGQTMSRRSAALDTATIKRYFYDKSQDNTRPLKNPQRVNAQIGLAVIKNGGDINTPGSLMNEWAWNSLIWVLAVRPGSPTQAAFYSHVGKGGRFHHSSFTAGGKVVCAGEWIVKNGHLRKISANSGHYRPPLGAFHTAVMAMSAAWHADTEVLLWNAQKQAWEYVNVSIFVRDPTGGGKWKTNPDA